MPTDSILVFAAATAMFAVFAGILMWGDRRTRPARSSLATGSVKRRSF
jgi:hypothetical protein